MDDLETRLSRGLSEIAEIVERNPAAVPSPARARRRRPPARMAIPAVALLLVVGSAGAITGWPSGSPDSITMAPGAPADGSPDEAAPVTPDPAVDDTAGELQNAFSDLPEFGQTAVDYAARQVTLYWKGTPPAEVSERVGSQDNGVTVVLLPALYSAADLRKASVAVMAAATRRRGPGATVGAGANRDMSGIVVHVVRPWTGSAEALERTAGVPVTVEEVDDGPTPSIDLEGLDGQGADASSAPPFSAETKKRLAKQGVTIASDREAASSAPISFERAKQIALENFRIIAGREPDEAEFGLVTNAKAGRARGGPGRRGSAQAS